MDHVTAYFSFYLRTDEAQDLFFLMTCGIAAYIINLTTPTQTSQVPIN